MNIIEQNETIDSILNTYKDYLGKEFEQYRNHVYRVYNLEMSFPKSKIRNQKSG